MKTVQEIITKNLSLAAKRALSVMRYKKGLARADIQAVLGLSQAFCQQMEFGVQSGRFRCFLAKMQRKTGLFVG